MNKYMQMNKKRNKFSKIINNSEKAIYSPIQVRTIYNLTSKV